MSYEDPFRVAVIVVIVLTMSIGVHHRLKAAATREKISHKEEGYVFAVILRLAGLGFWIALAAYLISPASMHRTSLSLPESLRWAGAGVGVLCAGLAYWTLSSLGKNLTDTVVTRESATLVTHGPYRWVRHPFYVTAALIMTSITVLTANWLIGAIGVFILGMLALRTPKEEQMLIARFGQPYRDYMARTRRFLPLPWQRRV